MRVLLIGAGVIGTVYGAQLGASGHTLFVLADGHRGEVIERDGLRVNDPISGKATNASAMVIDSAVGREFDIVLVAVRRDQLQSVASELVPVNAEAVVLFMGNTLAGHAAMPGGGRAVVLGFPGIGGTMTEDVVSYVKIKQQPTVLEAHTGEIIDVVARSLGERGFPCQRVADVEGWLTYHAVFITSVSAALYRCGIDPRRLASDKATLKLMCQAITEGFAELSALGVGGRPKSLALLHSRGLTPLAVHYWSRFMKSAMGEMSFAAHTRHAGAETKELADDVMTKLGDLGENSTLGLLLSELQ